MLISGSNSQCISDILNGDEAFNPLSLPAGEKIITEAGFTTEQLNYKPFMEFLQGCGMLYDYTHQRIIVYNPKCRYAYVYSMKDKQWGMMPSNIADGVNSYPDALAMTNDGSLINLSTDNTSDGELLKGIRGLVFTRPFKLGAPDLLKPLTPSYSVANSSVDTFSRCFMARATLPTGNWCGRPVICISVASVARLINTSVLRCSVNSMPKKVSMASRVSSTHGLSTNRDKPRAHTLHYII